MRRCSVQGLQLSAGSSLGPSCRRALTRSEQMLKEREAVITIQSTRFETALSSSGLSGVYDVMVNPCNQ